MTNQKISYPVLIQTIFSSTCLTHKAVDYLGSGRFGRLVSEKESVSRSFAHSNILRWIALDDLAGPRNYESKKRRKLAMESILRGVVNSDHPQTLKNQLLQRFFTGLDREGINHGECVDLFKLFIEWILVSERPDLRKIGHEQLVELAKLNKETFREFLKPPVIIGFFNNSVNTNKVEIAPLIGEILDILKSDSDEVNEEDGTLRSITNVAKMHLVHLLRNHGVHLEVAASIGRLYVSQSPSLLPGSPEWIKVTKLIVNLLSGYRCQDPNPVTGVVSTTFVEEADAVSEILPKIWGQSLESRECIQEGLKFFYGVISSSSDTYSRPSCALMSFIDKVPSAMMEKAMNTIIDPKENLSSDEGQTVTGLQTMIEWLTQRPSTLLSSWLIHMMHGLRKSGRFSVLIEITHGTLEKLLVCLPIPELQDSVDSLFFYLLLGFQHSETAFHRIISGLPEVLAKLKPVTNSPVFGRSKVILERLVEATHYMLNLFPDFPDLYSSLHRALKEITLELPDEKRMEELSTLAWLTGMEHEKNSQIHPNPRPIPNSIPTLATRSETGMVGLVNLGNTCYMNSVIQALYMSSLFCDMVLSFPLTTQQPVMMKLQQTFAYLRYTLRAIYSPSDLLKSARPPWFESGRQQDCSEFLRYLLDTLQEQEQSSARNVSGGSVFREHRVIEPPPPNKSGTTSESSSSGTSSEDIRNKVIETPNKSVSGTIMEVTISNHRSSECLDAISEAPETVPEVDPEMTVPDVDMISQGADEDFMFGSRNSLSHSGSGGIHTKLLEDNPELMDSDDEELSSSRNSLNGLKRWTTEENLSFNDPSGSRSELMEVPLNDSHSNSTDSGIQSVGDSIRGSSDSMSNGGSNGGHTASGPIASTSSSKTKIKNESTQQLQIKTLASASVTSPPSSDHFESVVQKVFGGKLQTTYECLNCKSVSLHKECFTDLHLAVPEQKNTKSNSETTNTTIANNFTMQTLLANYLTPETLQGENKYHCDHCGSLQDALKTMKIFEGPKYLTTTLMRFHYDRTQNRKSKVFTDIQYVLDLNLPVYVNDEPMDQLYSLYAIVVHSGYSSDGGHYYTYAREPMTSSEADLETYNKTSSWYVFNDSNVSLSSFESFKSVFKRFPRDTAYVMFYQKISQNNNSNLEDENITENNKDQENKQENSLVAGASSPAIPKLNSEVKLNVENDNVKFMREKERNSSAASSKSSNSTMSSWPRGPEDDGGPNGGSSRGCGGGGFNTPGRFVC